MPISPRILKLIAEGLQEAPAGVARAGKGASEAVIAMLQKTPGLAEALVEVLGKIKGKAPGIADALQEATASFLSGKKTPEMIREAQKARSIATGEDLLGRGTGKRVTSLEVGEKAGAKTDPSEIGEFVPVHKAQVFPETTPYSRISPRQKGLEARAGRIEAQMSPKEQALLRKKAFDPELGPMLASDEAALRATRQRFGLQEPQVPSQSIKAEEKVVPPGKKLWTSPKGAGKGSRLSKQEAQARAAEEAAPTWGQITKEGYQPPLPGATPPGQPWLSAPPRGYAQFLPQKGTMPEIRPGPLRPQAGPGVVPQKSYDIEAPVPKVEPSPEEMFVSPEVQKLYRRIILGKE